VRSTPAQSYSKPVLNNRLFFIRAKVLNALKGQTEVACYYESGSYHAISGVPEWPKERRNLVVSVVVLVKVLWFAMSVHVYKA